ncbi:MAG TPA: GDSL-type esterase/lipase family protein [Treponemataceae bacterium]|nr:GDSL-type esterase/lipase family protein [Treponemataceae bacterium]
MDATIGRLVGAALAGTLAVAGCASVNGPGNEIKRGSVAYERMIGRSLLDAGNNRRIKGVIAKARSGKEVTIAFIGGSITEGYNATDGGSPYAALVADGFRSAFVPEGGSMRVVNAGMAGTPSTIGMIRYRRDVLEKSPSPPDLVFVEFAVNDGDDPTNGAAFESLVRKILDSPNEPAVILIFSVFQSRWNLQDRLAPIGARYGLPMVSIKDAVVPELEKGSLSDEAFFSDIYHPTNYGHRLMADCVITALKAADAAPASPRDAPIPDSAGARFAPIELLDAARLPASARISVGSFTDKDLALPAFKSSGNFTFPENWRRDAARANEPLVLEIECRSLILVYKKSRASADFGEASVIVDGQEVDTLDGAPTGGWDNPWTTVLVDDEASERHRVEIKMASGSEGKTFTVLGFGYVK